MLNWFRQLVAPEKSSSDKPYDVATEKQRADAMLGEGNFAAAETIYRQIITHDPHHAKAHCNLGFVLKESGKTDEAEQHFAAALANDATLADAHYMMGQLNRDKSKFDSAEQYFRQAINLTPDFEFAYRDLFALLVQRSDIKAAAQVLHQASACHSRFADLHYYLANAMRECGQLEDAVEHYQISLTLNPEFAPTHNNLGFALHALGKFDAAITSYRQALALQPDFHEAYNNLGNAMRDVKQPETAVGYFRSAIQINPDFAQAHSNLGNALQDLGQLEDAASSYRRALTLAPDYAEIHNNLGNTLSDLGQFDEAVHCFQQALQRNPHYAEAQNNLGTTLRSMGKTNEAIASLQKAIQLKPDYADAHSNLGNILQDQGKYDEALHHFYLALEHAPEREEIHCNLGIALTNAGKFDEALPSFRRALELAPDFLKAYNSLLFCYHFLINQPAATMLADARLFSEKAREKARPFSSRQNPRDKSRRLRIGFVSGDLRNHPVGYFIEGVLASLQSHHAEQIEIFAYSNHFDHDAVTEKIKALCQRWQVVRKLSDESLAQTIHEDGIDILIDLSGHTGHNRLPVFAWKPAPIQVTWLGYFATTGVAAIDYLIADPSLPQTEEVNFTEKIWRLPETRLCFTAPANSAPVAPLPALANGHITFGCFNNLTKINDTVVAVWSKVLQAVPNSRLFLKGTALDDANGQQAIRARFTAHGIDATRIICEGFTSRADYFVAHNRVDINLDPFPYTGGTTSVESLWMGVPVLTLAGQHLLSRQGVGLLTNAGLPNWIATDYDHYVALAGEHGQDLPRLAALRSQLRQQVLASPLFDSTRFARHFAAALRNMWETWCDQP